MTSSNRVHESVQKFYTEKMESPDREVCCAYEYQEGLTDHIPASVLERAYGCGNPLSLNVAQPGMTVVDLGAGAGIDCFIASRIVGPQGRVIGLDMTTASLEKARAAAPSVAESLGYANVEFRRGHMESMPLDSESVDLIISNCVINLSPDKSRVLAEISRVLRPGGIVSISDIISLSPIPDEVRDQETSWEECVSGAITRDELFAIAGVHGIYLVETFCGEPWRGVPGTDIQVASVTLQGCRRDGSGTAAWRDGLTARYVGEGPSVVDSDGQVFRAGVPVAVTTALRDLFGRPPFAGLFRVFDSGEPRPEEVSGVGEPKKSCC